jgi:hypothetical protein
MPWRGPEVPNEFPTLGYEVGAWIQEHCAVPDGERVGDPYVLTDEMWRFLFQFYRIDPETERFHWSRGAQLVRAQKWGKGPLSAAIICAEADGPVIFDGWDAAGEPVGRPWPTPWIQITAVSEDQTDNVWRALLPMIDLGALSADIPDTGETRINLHGGGRIEPVTSNARSRLGQRITFAVEDETHSWTSHNGGRKLADTQRRNLAGMKGRWMETTNAWDPAEESVAQETSEKREPGVYFDDREPGLGSIRNKRERRKLLRQVYGDSWWVDLDRIEEEIEALLPRDPAQAERFFLNRKLAAEAAAFDLEQWRKLADSTKVVADKALITIGVDGARFDDALAVVGTDIEQGHQFVIGIWEAPESVEGYEHPMDEVDAAVTDAFETYDVWRAYVDPQYIEGLLDRWQGRWGEKRVIPWLTSRPRPTAFAVRNYRTAVGAGDLTHDGNEVMSRHIGNARRRKLAVYDDDHRPLYALSKDRPNSPRKIDAAMAGILAWEARGDAVAAGVGQRKVSIYESRGLETI